MKRLHSPNFADRGDEAVSMLVLHYTGMQSAGLALARLCQVEAKVSAHYVVDEDGTVYQLVDEAKTAWHAGLSFWRGWRNVNPISIGIEIVNPGHEWGYRAFPAAQMKAVTELCKAIAERHGIKPVNVVGHSDVAPERKEDPGELFDWKMLAANGVGLWPQIKGIADWDKDIGRLQNRLSNYGYDIAQSSQFDAATRKVVIAFQRHFRPADISGDWDGECEALLEELLARASSI